MDAKEEGGRGKGGGGEGKELRLRHGFGGMDASVTTRLWLFWLG